jgi:carbon storage regulator
MLILTRRVSEQLMIGENVQVTVLRIDGNQVRIGVTAPRDISVDRQEVRARKDHEQRSRQRSGIRSRPLEHNQ